jgi:CRP/FNR family transcriptional regulator, anaerobic regulatory protein
MSSKPLINYFSGLLPFSEEEIKVIENKIRFRKIKRRQMILQEGQVCENYTFVIKGCFRMYGIDDEGGEHNIQFAAENDWISDIESFYSGKQSKLFIEAIEPSSIIQIERKDMYFLCNSNIKILRIFKVMIENKYIELQNRVLNNISSTAQQRYLSFLEQYSTLSLRLPNVQIASYLGITPEFLSKIRKELSSKSPKS